MQCVRLSLIAFAASVATISVASADAGNAISPSFVVLGAPSATSQAAKPAGNTGNSIMVLGAPAAEKSDVVLSADSTPSASQISKSVVAFGEPAVEEFKVAAIDRTKQPVDSSDGRLSPHEAGKARLASIKFGPVIRVDKGVGPGAHANSSAPPQLTDVAETTQVEPNMAADTSAPGFAEPGRHAGSSVAATAAVAITAPAVTVAADIPAEVSFVHSSMVDFGMSKDETPKIIQSVVRLDPPAPGVHTSMSVMMFGTPTAEDIKLAALSRKHRRMSGPLVVRGGVVGMEGAAAPETDVKMPGKQDAATSDASAAKNETTQPQPDKATAPHSSTADAPATSTDDPASPATQEASAPTQKPHANPHRKPNS